MASFIEKGPFIKLVNVDEIGRLPRTPLTEQDVGESHRYTFNNVGMTFDKDLGRKGEFCYHPFNTVTIDHRGDCYVCVCQAWLPIPVGNIFDFESLDDIVQSPKAREIQASIIDGTYKYCDEKTCHLLIRNEMETKISHKPDGVNWINFAIDDSCNLQCPSCRTELIFHKEGEDFDYRMRMTEHISKLIERHKFWIKFTLSGDGDPFASHIYRNLLKNLHLTKENQVEIEIVTNGILVKTHWEEMPGVHQNVIRFRISYDAGSEEVYNITRRGGHWNKLVESTRYMVEWKQRTGSDIKIALNYVVQNNNYKDIVKFVKLAKDIGVDEIGFQKVTDWGKFIDVKGINRFAEHAVWMPDHPNHQELVALLNDPELYDPRVELTNLSHLGQKHPDKPSVTTK